MKIGDKVICINNDDRYGKKIKNLIMYNEYIILDMIGEQHKCKCRSSLCSESEDSDIVYWYFCDRFIEIKSYRKLKLEKIYGSTL
jgi:hypothetical protein